MGRVAAEMQHELDEWWVARTQWYDRKFRQLEVVATVAAAVAVLAALGAMVSLIVGAA